MKHYRDIVMEFDAGLQSLYEENSKERIDKLSYLAINHIQLANEFVQMIQKRIEMVL
jgi:hypothetical protein